MLLETFCEDRTNSVYKSTQIQIYYGRIFLSAHLNVLTARNIMTSICIFDMLKNMHPTECDMNRVYNLLQGHAKKFGYIRDMTGNC